MNSNRRILADIYYEDEIEDGIDKKWDTREEKGEEEKEENNGIYIDKIERFTQYKIAGINICILGEFHTDAIPALSSASNSDKKCKDYDINKIKGTIYNPPGLILELVKNYNYSTVYIEVDESKWKERYNRGVIYSKNITDTINLISSLSEDNESGSRLEITSGSEKKNIFGFDIREGILGEYWEAVLYNWKIYHLVISPEKMKEFFIDCLDYKNEINIRLAPIDIKNSIDKNLALFIQDKVIQDIKETIEIIKNKLQTDWLYSVIQPNKEKEKRDDFIPYYMSNREIEMDLLRVKRESVIAMLRDLYKKIADYNLLRLILENRTGSINIVVLCGEKHAENISNILNYFIVKDKKRDYIGDDKEYIFIEGIPS